jgi:hypothetical protein
MKAIIDPRVTDYFYISSWQIVGIEPNITYEPIYSIYPNSCRVAEVQPNEDVFLVAEPLFWTDCPDDCVQDEWYYDTVEQICKPIVNAPMPTLAQPETSGTETI